MLNYRGVTIKPCAGVYQPAEDSFLMVDAIKCGKNVLEIGTGTGIISIYCASNGSKCTATDISEKALECARFNAELNGVKIEFIHSNLFLNIRGKYDTIIFNPPYLPTDDNIEESEQWDGGPDGFRVTRQFLKCAWKFLEKNGEVYLILSDLTDINSLIAEFKNYNFNKLGENTFESERIIVFSARPA
ncbi:methyltransferase [Oxyplasma meridianum]|uniref:Methyltransferase n=1 Tax=Oxyplasma meridianum TaxID=3073602 RepID=A0AAX4NIE7_9ARCH